MIKVTDIVADLLATDELAQEALRAGLLNLSAYADLIHKKVENATMKNVKRGTIVVALSRLSKGVKSTPSLMPHVELTNLSFKSSLSILTYEKTPENKRKISVLNPFSLPLNDLYSITEGPSEISIVCGEHSKKILKSKMDTNAKSEQENLVAVTAEFAKAFVHLPNIQYVLMAALASKRIQVIEVISTYLEISFIIKKEDMEQAIKALNIYFRK